MAGVAIIPPGFVAIHPVLLLFLAGVGEPRSHGPRCGLFFCIRRLHTSLHHGHIAVNKSDFVPGLIAVRVLMMSGKNQADNENQPNNAQTAEAASACVFLRVGLDRLGLLRCAGSPSPGRQTFPSWCKPARIWPIPFGFRSRRSSSPTVHTISATPSGQITPAVTTASVRHDCGRARQFKKSTWPARGVWTRQGPTGSN